MLQSYRLIRACRAALCAVALLALAAGARAAGVITYTVTPDFAAREWAVTMTVPNVTGPTVRFELPVWSPGAYFASNTSVNVDGVSAEDSSGKALMWEHPDQQMWEVEANGAPEVVFNYRIKNADLEQKRGHISGPRTYMYVVGRKSDSASLGLMLPTDWKVACSLDPAGGFTVFGHPSGMQFAPPQTHSSFSAPTYDVLADAPVEMGDFDEQDFTVGTTPFRVVLYGNTSNIDRAKLKDYCERVARTETAFFHDIPFKRYVFMFRAAGGTQGGAGGLEHLGSTEISLRGVVDDRVRYVIAHEFFHAWNVKRIRPFVLGPFDYINPPHTANLWWSEGVTDYYANLLSRRGGLIDDAGYLTALGNVITELQNNPARLKVRADEASRRVWEANNSQGLGLSYYTKGDMVGLCLDLKIRQVTGGRASLDDVMKSLYEQCGRGKGPGFGEDAIKTTVNKIAGQDLYAFYDRLARSTEEMPFAECLGYAGLDLKPAEKPDIVPSSGMTAAFDRGSDFRAMRVRIVEPEGAAEKAGLKPNDLIVAVNGAEGMQGMTALRAAKPGATLTLTVERAGQRQDIPFTMGQATHTRYTVDPSPNATQDQQRLRAAWLGGR